MTTAEPAPLSVVLVHGAWHGPSCWDRVSCELSQHLPRQWPVGVSAAADAPRRRIALGTRHGCDQLM